MRHSHRTLVSMAYERMRLLIDPPGKHSSPVQDPTPIHRWREMAGMCDDEHEPRRIHEAVKKQYPGPLDCGRSNVHTVVMHAMRKLAQAGLVEKRRGGWRRVGDGK